MLKEIFGSICKNKFFVLRLKGNKLREYRTNLYKLPLKEWQINLMWEMLMGDVEKEKVEQIFRAKGLL